MTPARSIFFFAVFSVVVFSPVAVAKPLAKVTVEAGQHTRIDTPVSAPLEGIANSLQAAGFRLEEIRALQRLPAASQVEPGNPPRLWWILSGTTAARTTRVFELSREVGFKDPDFVRALENGRQASEGFERCQKYVRAWLRHADPTTGLIPKGLRADRRDIWNAQDAAADNYPFMVLTAAITDRPLFDGRMLDMLRTEIKLTSRIGVLPDTYSFSKQDFRDPTPDIGRIIYGASEYVKDGLLPLTEWLGKSPWSERMLSIVDDMWRQAPIETKYGRIVSTNQEINGEMLQTLSRVYWMTGEKKYLDWAVRLGDYYLLDEHHPTKDETKLKLRDHGCEIVSGLCELYATVHFAMPEKKRSYQGPLHQMLDRILEAGRNEHGLFYNSINPQTGEHSEGIADTWGYDLNGYYTVYLIDKTESYREAVLKALGAINEHYRNYRWEGNYGADGFADSIESAINLYNREPVPSAAEWIDSETKVMWSKQQPDGIIEGWHGDGNFARTTMMYCLWKTRGVTIQPWRKDIRFGAVQQGDILKIAIVAGKEWNGKILFDKPRHKTNMSIPLDWPRINQFPEWFTVESRTRYSVRDLTSNSTVAHTGKQLQKGITINLRPGIEQHLLVEPATKSTNASVVAVTETDSFLDIEAGPNKILRYNHAIVPPPPGADKNYGRSAFIHPLWSPGGAVLTNIHPSDHIHHMGLWMPWANTEFEGRSVDFWNLKKAQGTVRFVEFASKTSGPVFGGFRAIQEHVDLSGPGGAKPALNEAWDVRVYNVGGPGKGYWLLDFTSTQSCASSSPLHLLKYRYGGLGFRATGEWKEDNSNYLTSEGRTRKDGHGTRSRWCDVFGPTATGPAGVLFMSHPENHEHPEPMRIWPTGDVFFNYCPIQKADWTLEPGKHYLLKYRLCVHDGKMTCEAAERFWQDFGNPPTVKVKILQ